MTQTSLFNFFCRNISEDGAIKTWATGLNGVAETQMGIINEYILVKEGLDEEITDLAQLPIEQNLSFNTANVY